MSLHQLELIYGVASPFNDTQTLARLQAFMANATQTEIDQQIRKDLHQLAAADQIKIRSKRDVVLSPITFTVIGPGTSVNSPVILS